MRYVRLMNGAGRTHFLKGMTLKRSGATAKAMCLQWGEGRSSIMMAATGHPLPIPLQAWSASGAVAAAMSLLSEASTPISEAKELSSTTMAAAGHI